MNIMAGLIRKGIGIMWKISVIHMTYQSFSFQNSYAVETWLLDFQKITIKVL